MDETSQCRSSLPFRGIPKYEEDLDAFGAPADVVRATASMKPSEVVFLGHPPLRIDLLRTIDGLTTEEVLARAISTELDGVPLRVSALDDLIAKKRATGRPLDEQDAELVERARDRAP